MHYKYLLIDMCEIEGTKNIVHGKELATEMTRWMGED